MDNLYLEIINKRKQIEIVNIKICNEITSKYGLVLSDNQISNIYCKSQQYNIFLLDFQ